METLAEATDRAETRLRSSRRSDVARLDRQLIRLRSDQIELISRVLTGARARNLAAETELTRLEQSFETWWNRSLAQKLAILECITELGETEAASPRQLLLPDSLAWIQRPPTTEAEPLVSSV